MGKIKAVMYDLDGTIIDSVHLHRMGWEYAASRVGIKLTEESLARQKGMPNAEATQMMLGEAYSELGQEFILQKKNFVIENIGMASVFPNFSNTLRVLSQFLNGMVWICTSASKEFMLAVFAQMQELAVLKDKTVWREMYDKGKPSGEPLLFTAKKIGVNIKDCLYVGDAVNDWLSAKDAGCNFIHLRRDDQQLNEKMPDDVKYIENHIEIADFVL